METQNGKRFALLILLTVVAIPLFVFLMGYVDDNVDELLKYLFGEQILDYRILNIKGTARGIFSAWFYVFAILMLMAYFILCVKISGVIYKLYPCTIFSTKVKVSINQLRPDLLNKHYFYSATDEQLVIKNKATKLKKYAWFALVLFFAFAGYMESKGDGDYKGTPFLFWGLGTYAFIYWVYLVSYTHTVIFDRTTGLVTIPNLFGLPSRRVKLEDVYQGSSEMYSYMEIRDTYTYIPFTIPGYGDRTWWSFYVWYMDRNRPLPRGTLFDAYRERDFKRREALGFPKPLYETTHGVVISDKHHS